MANLDLIVFYNDEGAEVGRVERCTHKRISQRAAAEHKKMDAFAASNPSVVRAVIGGRIMFEFRGGRSQMTPGQI